MKIMRNVESGQCKDSLVRIQVRWTAFFLGKGWLPNGWSGLQVGIFAPSHNPKIGYRCIAFYAQLLPGMPGVVPKWPKWYRWIHRQMKFRRIASTNKQWI